MARVKVLYFAAARDATGKSGEFLQLGEPATAGSVLDALVESCPTLGPLKSSIRVAVNHELVPLKAAVKDGDELAILPPVAGG